ncbi:MULTISPECIES: 2TM domain-containing protein [Altibacter]|uniref:2TM domain-containing protein n=1 Tax=Altibacter TaxID=1535231 RepID=UPI000556C44B|nr:MULTISPECIES: 2TM domain-containing protein [Altibacter]MCW8980402.1 2TM domain-containing protein [Altibacter sp.]MCW9036805.1 2TM domain-containing protein [Altibacter sp.]
MNDLEKQNKYIRAKERVADIKKFYTSLMLYVVFIGFLAALNYYTNELRYPWFLWAAFGWGIGIVIQAVKAFRWMPYMNKEWEERKIKEYMEKDSENSSGNRWQ